MWTEEQMIEYLKDNLKESRFNHSIGVRDTAIKLAKIYGEDEEKAKIAGLIHDCAKYINNDNMLNISKKYGHNITEVEKNTPSILHGCVGAYIAENIMGITDKYILDAIIYHTTGRKNMTLLDKIIYLADYIEPLRNFPGVDNVRNIAYNKGLDEAIMISFNNTIKYVIERNQLLHNKTVEARNYMLFSK